nr:T9SS type A sorting domain-containing protein [uncultured Flavobacterium sp.]
MKKILLFILLPIAGFAQSQIGNDIYGDAGNNQFGSSVAISADGTIFASGGIGFNTVRVYKNEGGSWIQLGTDLKSSWNSGTSISLSSDGSIIAIGNPENSNNGSNAGSVDVYKNVSGTWTTIGNLYGLTAGDFFGTSVSISSDGSILGIGAYNKNGSAVRSGQVTVFQNISGSWTQIGNAINGKLASERFGKELKISADGSILAVGAPESDGNGSDSGQVRVFQNISGNWTQIGNDINGEAEGDLSGNNLALSSDGTILAIGAPRNDGNGSDSGHVRVYFNNAGTWKQIGSDINGEEYRDYSGQDVALSSDGIILAVGAIYNYGKAGKNTGHVRTYQNVAGVWKKFGSDIDGTAVDDNSGGSLAFSSNGRVLVIGAVANALKGPYTGQVRVFSLTGMLSTDKFVMDNFSVSPNPASELITISLDKGLSLEKVNIYNTLGQLIKTENKNVISVNTLSKGTYFFEVITDKGKGTKQIIVQ